VPGSHAEEIVVDYFEAEDWALLDDADAEPELDLPPDGLSTVTAI
jgi:hypothetical protein